MESTRWTSLNETDFIGLIIIYSWASGKCDFFLKYMQTSGTSQKHMYFDKWITQSLKPVWGGTLLAKHLGGGNANILIVFYVKQFYLISGRKQFLENTTVLIENSVVSYNNVC